MAAALVVSPTWALAGTRVKSQLSKFGAPCLKALSFASRKPVYKVRCDANDSGAEGAKKAISKLDNLLRKDSEEKLGFGTKPAAMGASESAPPTEDLDFGALFALDGPVPEILSGRLAMFGMASALGAEKATGLTVLEQVFTRGFMGLVFFAGAVQLLTYASLMPITKGESVDSRSLGPFTARAERWNGRLAMVGFLLLVVTEALRHAPLFQ